MAKVKVNINAQDLIRDIQVSPKALAAIGDFWVKRIQGTTRTGNSLATGKQLKPLSGASAVAKINRDIKKGQRNGASFSETYSAARRALSDAGGSYIAYRMAYTGPTGKAFSPHKSNLTLTGQLLESLKFTTDKNRQTVKVTPVGTREDGLTNNDLAGYVAEQGRPFLGLDEKGRARMIRIIIDDLRRTLRNRKTGFRKLSRMVGD